MTHLLLHLHLRTKEGITYGRNNYGGKVMILIFYYICRVILYTHIICKCKCTTPNNDSSVYLDPLSEEFLLHCLDIHLMGRHSLLKHHMTIHNTWQIITCAHDTWHYIIDNNTWHVMKWYNGPWWTLQPQCPPPGQSPCRPSCSSSRRGCDQ